MRRCAKITCPEPAAATVALRYSERVAWLRGLPPERDPNFLELCAIHADRMTVPVGWTRVDERGPSPGAPKPAPARTELPAGQATLEEPAADIVPAGASLLPLG